LQCASSQASKRRVVQKLKVFGTTDTAPGTLYAVIGKYLGNAAVRC